MPGKLNLSAGRLALLTERLAREGRTRVVTPVIPARTDRRAAVGLTPPQSQMWFMEQVIGGASPYVIPGGFRVIGDFSTAAFERACHALVARHESLRTVFIEESGVPMQVVLDELAPEIIEAAMPDVDADQIEPHCLDRLTALARRPFDLVRGPLLRVELLHFGTDHSAVLLCLHHIVADLWSMGVLMRELKAFYHSELTGTTAGLAPLNLQFPDYALWSTQPGAQTARQSELDWWVERLQGLSDEPGLVTDWPRPAVKTFRGEAVPVVLPPLVIRRIKALASAVGVTPFMVFSAAFHVFLARLSGRSDTAFGTPVMGRPLGQLEPLIGCFMNTVTLRADTSDNPSFHSFLRRHGQDCLEALTRGNVAFEEVVEELNPQRSLSRNPLFQVMLTYQNVPLPQWQLGSTRIEPISLEPLMSKFDLQLDLREEGEHINAQLSYSCDLFHRATVERMGQIFVRLLTALVDVPEKGVHDAALLDEAGRAEVVRWGTGAPMVPASVPHVGALVSEQAVLRPTAIALVCDGESLSYRELEECSDRLAAWLTSDGVRPGEVVALCLPTGIGFFVALLACWKVGAAYLPLDMDWPEGRVDFLLGDSGARGVITTRGADNQLGQHPRWYLEDCPELTAESPTLAGSGKQSVAYIIYTSGSTGRPKGVRITHDNLLAYLAGTPASIGFGHPGARYALLQAAVTDFGNTVIFSSLTTGGELHVLTHDLAVDPDLVAAYLSEHQIDCIKMVPTHFAALAEVVGGPALLPRHSLVFGGEAASLAQVTQLCRTSHGTQIHNHYGPTESTIGVVTMRWDEQDFDGYLPLGRPVPGARCYVVDEAGRLLPPGIIGELWVAGPQVADGYLDRDELSATHFLTDPFFGTGLAYRTGDRVCWTSEGLLRFFGRDDAQAKVRGFRIEPAEIEAVLAEDPNVSRALVLMRVDHHGQTQVVAYVTPVVGATIMVGTLRAHAARMLAPHAVPSAIVVMERFPLTHNGKVDRQALPNPQPTSNSTQLDLTPSTPTELVLATAFGEVLGLTEVPVTTGFFELGGDSIQAIRLVSVVRAAGLAISTRDVFIHQNVSALAAAIADRGEMVPLNHDSGLGLVGPTPIMARFQGFNVDVRQYSHRMLIALPAGTTAAYVRAGLRAVMAHHPILAGRLLDTSPWTMQVEPVPANLDVVSEAVLTGDEDACSAIVAAQAEEAVARLDPWAGHHVQAVYLEREEEERAPLLLLVVHHLVVDGVSWSILLSDLAQAVTQIAQGGSCELTPVEISARGWSELIASDAQTPERRAELPVWEALVEGTKPLPVRSGRARGPVREDVLRIPSDLACHYLEYLPERFQISVQEALLAAVAIAVGTTLTDGAQDLLVEVESHGRSLEGPDGRDTTRTVGWLTSVHPVKLSTGQLRADVISDRELVRDCFVRLVQSQRNYPFDGLGYGMLRYLNPTTSPVLARLPEAQLAFNYMGAASARMAETAWQPVTIFSKELLGVDGGASPVLTRPLHINVFTLPGPRGTELSIQLLWSRELWQDEDMDALVAQLPRVLTGLAERLDSPELAVAIPPRLELTIRPTIRVGELPLTFAQLCKVSEPVGADSAHHNVVAAVVLRVADPASTEVLDEAALSRALNRILERHEILRTSLHQDPSHPEQWRQVVHPSRDWPLFSLDIREREESQRRWLVDSMIEAEQQQPLPVAAGVPMRTLLVRTGEREWTLIQTFHHVALDPWGFAQFLTELTEGYRAERLGEEPRLDHLPIQYADVALWQQRQLAVGPFQVHEDYWREQLRDLPLIPTFDSITAESVAPLRGFTEGFVLSRELTAELKAMARSRGVSFFMLLLTCFQALQGAFTGGQEIATTFPLVGREVPETHPLIGYFISEVVVRSHPSDERTFVDLLIQVRDATLAGYEHQLAAVRLLSQPKSGRLDPFRIMFNLVDFGAMELRLGGLVGIPVQRANADFALIPELNSSLHPENLDLYLALHERAEQLRGVWLFSPDYIDPAVMAAMTAAWPHLLAEVIKHPEISLGDLRDVLRQCNSKRMEEYQ